MKEKQPQKPHVSPRVRAYGKARIDIAQRILTRLDWETLWKKPMHPFPFQWGRYWKQCIEYRVDDFAAEIGFFIDILGFPVIAFDSSYAMFTSPNGDFTFAVVQTPEGSLSTPPDAIRIQFMVLDILATVEELTKRGIHFLQNPEPLSESSSMYLAAFQTPHGVLMEIWGEISPKASASSEAAGDDEIKDGEEEAELNNLEEDLDTEIPSDSSSQEDEFFEVVHEAPSIKRPMGSSDRAHPNAPSKGDQAEEFPEPLQYVDEPEPTYQAYKPIPFNK